MDTIVAIASGISNSGISIIRVSGADAIRIVDSIFYKKASDFSLKNSNTYTLHYGEIRKQKEILDEVIVLLMKEPKSYTREDVVEINCHGGIIVTKKILELIIETGARPAEPGEFTKRAFLNGRIDLSQAEAVMDLIQAKNELAMKNSITHLKGKVLEKVKEIREKILYDLAFIEAALDDPEHIELDGFSFPLKERILDLLKELNNMKDSSENGRMLKEGIRTVILGKPNVGKSSLLNRLLREERAIVTEIAGTTRDTLEETILLHGISLTMVDTAGIRSTEDLVEKIGIERAKKFANEADLILYVVDISIELDENDREILSMIQDKKTIIVLNKTDLPQKISRKDLIDQTGKPVILFSAKKDIGLEDLENKIKDLFFQGELRFNDEVYLTNLRQKKELLDAIESLKCVVESIDSGMPEDFFSIDLTAAYKKLGNIIGETMEEDLVNKIFQEFCMGK